MFSDFIQPATLGQASLHHVVSKTDAEGRGSFQTLPMNLSPEEIRAMIQDILG